MEASELINLPGLQSIISRPGSDPTGIANTPGSGLGDGNLLCGGVVYLYPYSIESSLRGRKFVLPSHSTFKLRLSLWRHPDELVAILSRRWEHTYSQYEMLRLHRDYSAWGSINDSV